TVYFYGNNNTLDYGELLNTLRATMDTTLQDDVFDIVVHGPGYLFDRSRVTGGWGGDRNRYSKDVAATAQALLDRGVATPSMPIWLGNWAANEGEHVGSMRSLTAETKRRQLVLFHGTDTFRLEQIMQGGLKPLGLSDRVWNAGGSTKNRPTHREDS